MHLRRVEEIQFLAQPGAQGAKRSRRHPGLIGHEKYEVARLGFEALNDRMLVSDLKELGDRRIEPCFRDAEKCQPFGLEVADKHRQLVDLLAAVLGGGAGGVQSPNTPARSDGVLEDAEPGHGGDVADCCQFYSTAWVRLV